MINIVVFGKPKAFESYEFEFEERFITKNENTHIEPYIKPIRQNEVVLHYYTKDDYACYEYYVHANGFDSDRIGGVFGISIKSDKDINLYDAQKHVLIPFRKDLANSFLYNDNSFNTQSIINQISKTQWIDSEQQIIGNVISNSEFIKPTKGLLLLVVPNFEEIANIEPKIKEYDDVFIADNQDIFKDSNNALYLKRANNQVFIVEDGNFVLFTNKKDKNADDSGKKGFERVVTKGNGGKEDGDNDRGFNRGGYSGGDYNGGNYTPPPEKTFWEKHKTVFLSILVTLVVVGVLFLILGGGFKGCSNSETDKNKSGSSKVEPTNPQPEESYVANSVILKPQAKPIKVSWDVEPTPIKMVDGQNKTTTLKSEISLNISGAGKDYVYIDGTVLKVTSRPDKDTKVTVIAYLNMTELGRQEYTIAKKEVVTSLPIQQTPSKNGNKIPKDFRGSPRTIDQFITDLENTLNNDKSKADWVQGECQKIINGEYGTEYKNNSKAVVLRDKAKSSKGGNASSAF